MRSTVEFSRTSTPGWCCLPRELPQSMMLCHPMTQSKPLVLSVWHIRRSAQAQPAGAICLPCLLHNPSAQAAQCSRPGTHHGA